MFQCISLGFQYLICREEENSDEDSRPVHAENDTFEAAILYQVCKIDKMEIVWKYWIINVCFYIT